MYKHTDTHTHRFPLSYGPSVKKTKQKKPAPLHIQLIFMPATGAEVLPCPQPGPNSHTHRGQTISLMRHTQVVWASSPSIFCFKPRDYCTYVHYRKHADGTIIVLNRAASHPEAPPNEKYVRAEVLMGASIIQPVADDPDKCVFTTIAHINPGGLVPPFLVNKLCARGPVEFHSLVEKAAQRTRTMPKTAGDAATKYASDGGGPAAIA